MLRAASTLVGVLALLALALQALLHSLDRPWLKRRLLGAISRSAGVELAYGAARVDLLSGLFVEGLCVRQPPELRAFATDLVCADRVTASWSPASLWGAGPRLKRLRVSGLALAVTVDERGRTSFDALAHGPPSPPRQEMPLSRRASSLFDGAPPVGAINVDGARLILIRTERGAVLERCELDGLAMAVNALPGPAGARWSVKVHAGSPGTPLEVRAARTRAAGAEEGARAKFWLSAGASPTAVNVALDLHVLDQSLAPTVSVADALHVEGKVRFDPDHGLTEISVDPLVAGDGAATAAVLITVPDAGDPVVQGAHGDVDVARLLRWLPAGVFPASAERARVRWQAESLLVGDTPRLADGGSLWVDASLANVSVDTAAGRALLAEGTLSVRLAPAEEGTLAARGSGKLRGARFSSGQARLAADDVDFDLDGKRGADATETGRLSVGFSRIDLTGGVTLVAREGRAELRVADLHPNLRDALATAGDLALTVGLGSLEARTGAGTLTAGGLTLRARTTGAQDGARALEADLPASHVQVVRPDGKTLVEGPAHVEAKATDLRIDLAHPSTTRGVLHASLESEGVRATLDATKEADAVDYGLQADARSLGVVRPWLSAAWLARAPWDRIAVTVRSTGRIDRIGDPSPSLHQSTEVDLERPALDAMSAPSLALVLRSQGTSLSQTADVELRLPGLAFDGGAPSDDRLSLSTTVDRARASAKFKLATEGHVTTAISGSIRFEADRRALVYDVEGRAAGLAPLARVLGHTPGLEGLDLSDLEVALSARGALRGVLAGVSGDGSVALEPDAARTAALEGTTDLRVSHFRWARGDTAVVSPALTWHGEMRDSGPRRTLESRLEIGTLHLDLGRHDLDLNGVHADGSVSMEGDWADPHLDFTQQASVGAVAQDLVPEYPLGDLSLTFSGQRNPGGIVHVSQTRLANGLGATMLEVAGNVDLGEGRRTLALATSVTQDLARLSKIPERFTGNGRVTVKANVASPDLSVFTVQAVVKGEGVTFLLPRQGIEVDSASGEVPIELAFRAGGGGIAFARTGRRDPYSMLRFADQHPLLTHSGFLSIGRLRAPFLSISPLVGNLEIEQNVVSLRQFEMGIRGGTVTGQCGLDWDGPRSTLELHVRASRVQSSHGEPFDGNVSVVVSAADRTVEGRAEILHMGERHLLDLLELQDPLHVDPAINRIRTALHFGYPDRLRLVFDHGFASAHLELGGLARLISIGEVRGIPVGPIVDKTIGTLLEGSDPRESP
ncbi:MAG TPA: hypothetical protein VKU41_16295 [Polyangiaceae bacterium]|nr:hypothetical protein [Polyangiaceae bacterium]